MGNRVKTGDTESIQVPITGSTGTLLTGLSDVYVRLLRQSDGQFYDWNDGAFKAAGWVTLNKALTPVDATRAPGLYEVVGGLPTVGFSGKYTIVPVQTPGTNARLPNPAEIEVGGWIDKTYEIDTDLAVVDTVVDATLALATTINANLITVDSVVDAILALLGTVSANLTIVDTVVDAILTLTTTVDATATLIRKVLLNRLTLADVTGVVNIYDDNDVDILRTFTTTDKNDGTLSLPTGTPVNRTRAT